MSAGAFATASEGTISRFPVRASIIEARLARVADLAAATAAFAVSLAVYSATIAPGLTYVSLDGNELATVPHQLGLLHSPGYPFYTWMGKAFTFLPLGDVAFRMNLMSSLSAAGASALLYGIVVTLSRSRIAALFAATLFAFSPTLWSQAVITEVYAPNVFMVALTLFLLFQWNERCRGRSLSRTGPTGAFFLWGACLVFGLSMGTHLSNLALAPALLLYIWMTARGASIPRSTLLMGGGLFLLTLVQFAWLPLRASTLNDELMIEYTPDNPRAVFEYMFNVFHEDRFAFPLSALPDRISVYADTLERNFGYWGLMLFMPGIWEMFRRQRKAFSLLALAYLAEIGYFTQYNVSDIAVFFIPAHLIFVLFIAFGVSWFLRMMLLIAGKSRLRIAAGFSLSLVLVFPVTNQLQQNWGVSDHSSDTTVKDFHSNIFRLLPQNAVLVGKPGVPGFDLFHHYLVDHPRPDVVVPQVERPDVLIGQVAEGKPVYTTAIPAGRNAETGASEGGMYPDDAWFVPVLAAPSVFVSWLGGHALTLYEMRDEPPPLIVESVNPQHLVGREMDGVELIGFDLAGTEVKAGGTLSIRLYWRLLKEPVLSFYQVATTVGNDSFREIHPLGFRLISQYQQRGLPLPGNVVVEEYQLVIMSSLEPGTHALSVAACDFGSLGSRTEERVDLAEIEIVP